MVWHSYNLDRKAQKLVLEYRDADVLNESHKMRVTVAYGLERFWGEHLRLLSKDSATERAKGKYWQATWEAFVKIMKEAGIKVPKGKVDPKDTKAITETAEQFWDTTKFSTEDQKIALAVLTQFCDCLVWWTQRYKKKSQKTEEKIQHERESE